MMHPLKNTQHITTSDSWILGLLAGGELTGSRVVDSALSAMTGGELSELAPSQGVLDVAEPWLASRAGEAWAWIGTHPPEWRKYLGGWIQAGADRSGLELINGPLEQSASPAIQQLLQMEWLARQAGAGNVSANDVRLQFNPGFLPSPVCAAFLAAQANLNPLKALNLAVKALERQRWESLNGAVMYCVRQGCREPSIGPGIVELLREQISRHTLLIDVVCWTEVAAHGGAFEPDELRAHLDTLAPQVADAVEPDNYWMAALPLIRTALRCDCPEVLFPHFAEWELGAWELIDLVIRCDARSDGAWQLVERACNSDTSSVDAPGWWQAARDSDRLAQMQTLIRDQLLSGAAAGLPCHPHRLWEI